MYKVTFYKITDFDSNEPLVLFSTTQVPKHKDSHVRTNRLYFYLWNIMDRVQCYKSKYFDKAPKVFYNRHYLVNYVELGSIDNVPLDILNEVMPYVDSAMCGFDGWAFLPLEKYRMFVEHATYKDTCSKIIGDNIPFDIYIKYERIQEQN